MASPGNDSLSGDMSPSERVHVTLVIAEGYSGCRELLIPEVESMLVMQ